MLNTQSFRMSIDKFHFGHGVIAGGVYDPSHNPLIWYTYDGKLNTDNDIPAIYFEKDSIWDFLKYRYAFKHIICVLYNPLDLYSAEFQKRILWNKLDRAFEKSLTMSGQISRRPLRINSQILDRVLKVKNSIPLSHTSSVLSMSVHFRNLK